MLRIVYLLPAVLILYCKFGNTDIPVPIKSDPTTTITTLDHSVWDKLLMKHVDHNGNVDYKGFAMDIKPLKEYLQYLAQYPPHDTSGKAKKLAYYINLYNAATVKLVLDHYPLKSIKDIRNPWGRNVVQMGGTIISLGDLEHKILRKMDEPRIHFAINCASYSCPKLLNRAFTETNMERALEQTAMDFINDPNRNILSAEKASLSQIFNWYKKDFTENGSLKDYINQYASQQLTSETKINYLSYNWALNEIK